MFLLRFIWRLLRRHLALRLLLWIVVQLVRWFGWWRSARWVFRQRRRAYAVVVGLWQASVRLLRLGRSVVLLIGWIRKNGPLMVGRGKEALRVRAASEGRRLRAPDSARSLRTRAPVRSNLSSRVARRRDEIRRSVLAAMGVDPNWRPKRQSTGSRANTAKRHARPGLGGGVPEKQARS